MDTLTDALQHHTVLTIDKYADAEAYARGERYERHEHEGNLITSGGVQILWQLFSGESATAYSHDNAYVGVGDSTTASTSGMTDLQASSNKLRRAVQVGSPGRSLNFITYQAVFSGSDANFAWNEFSVFNDPSAGVMFNRAVSSGGTKTLGQVWVAAVTIYLF